MYQNHSPSRLCASAHTFRRKATSRATSLLGLACSATLLLLSASASAESQQCQQNDNASPYLQVTTSAGDIGIRLFPDAAPNTVATLTALVTEPLAAEAVHEPASEAYYYDGLSIDYTRPHIEVRTSKRPAADVVFPQEIDARALGLHEERVSSPGQAMNVIQDKLLPAFRKARHSGELSAQLERWVAAWYDGYKADFLVGVSRKQINEALGFSYAQGLASRPVAKGTVALKPASTRFASPVLSIALKDMPKRTGQWMVVGEVVHGLDLAEQISLAPLDRPTHVRSRSYQPRNPVVIESVRMECG